MPTLREDELEFGDLKGKAKQLNLRLSYLRFPATATYKAHREPIIISRKAKYKGCHLYDGFRDGVGLWITGSTPLQATYRAKKAESLGAIPLVRADGESTFWVPTPLIPGIASWLGLFKGKLRGAALKRGKSE